MMQVLFFFMSVFTAFNTTCTSNGVCVEGGGGEGGGAGGVVNILG